MAEKTYRERIMDAVKIGVQYGQIDGSHHRLWVIDQMLRALAPNLEVYQYWTAPEGDQSEWDVGIPP